MSTPAEVTDRLLWLPGSIEEAERRVIELTHKAERAKLALEAAESTALLATGPDGFPIINGKNAEQRQAQLFHVTQEPRRTYASAREERDLAAIRLHRLENEMSALRSVSRILRPEVD